GVRKRRLQVERLEDRFLPSAGLFDPLLPIGEILSPFGQESSSPTRLGTSDSAAKPLNNANQGSENSTASSSQSEALSVSQPIAPPAPGASSTGVVSDQAMSLLVGSFLAAGQFPGGSVARGAQSTSGTVPLSLGENSADSTEIMA